MLNFHAVEVEGCKCPETFARRSESKERISSLVRALRKTPQLGWEGCAAKELRSPRLGLGTGWGTLMINVTAAPGPSILTSALSRGGGIYLEVLSSKLFRKRV